MLVWFFLPYPKDVGSGRIFVQLVAPTWESLACPHICLCPCLRRAASLCRQLLPHANCSHAPCLFVPPHVSVLPQGRIFVLAVQGGKFSIVCERETRGAVYQVAEFQGRLLAGINSRVQMYK